MVSPVLVGRDSELATLVSGVSEPPAVLSVEGTAGVGKTRLVTELLGRPELAGRLPLVGRCQQIRESFPLGPVVEAVRGVAGVVGGRRLDPVAGALRPLLPELVDVLPPAAEPLHDRIAERHRVFRGLVALLSGLGSAVLVLEDLHWAEQQTTDFLGYLLADPPPKLTVAVTYRSEEVSPAVRAVAARLPAAVARAHVELAPLDQANTAALAASILGVDRVSAEFSEFLWAHTSGLPYAVEEVLAVVHGRGLLVPARGGGWFRRMVRELEVPRSIRDSMLERVARLSTSAQRVAEAAAVLQTPAGRAEVAAVAGGDGDPVAPLEEALVSGVLIEQDGRIGFRHLLAAQAVYGHLSGPRRQDLHAHAAKVLRALDPVPLGQVAFHLKRAGRVDEWVVAAERAADHAVELANDDEAARLLEDVLRHGRLDAEQRARITVKLGWAAIHTLHARDVTDLLSDTLALDPPRPVRGELQFLLAQALNQTGEDLTRQYHLFRGAVEDLDDRPDLRAWSMVALGIPTVPGIEPSEHVAWLRRALELVAQLGDPLLEVHILGKAGGAWLQLGDRAWRSVADRIIEVTEGAPRQRREANAYYSIGLEACFAGHLQTADVLLREGLQAPVVREDRKLQILLRSGQALLNYHRGAWDGLRDEVETLRSELADHPRDRLDVDVVAGCLVVAAGELHDAIRQLRGVVELAQQIAAYQVLPLAAGALARAAQARGDLDTAVSCVRVLVEALDAKGVWPPLGWALPTAVDALTTAGELTEASALVARCAEELRDRDAPLGPAALQHAQGIMAAVDRRWPQAVQHLVAAVEAYRELRCPYQEAQAGEAAAAAMFEAEDARAEVTLGSSLAGYLALGAAWDHARAARLARQHGLLLAPRHRGGRKGYGSELSPQERKVAGLAATGRTNRQIAAELFLSPNTVDKHMRAAMRKLGVRSRAALAQRLVREPG